MRKRVPRAFPTFFGLLLPSGHFNFLSFAEVAEERLLKGSKTCQGMSTTRTSAKPVCEWEKGKKNIRKERKEGRKGKRREREREREKEERKGRMERKKRRERNASWKEKENVLLYILARLLTSDPVTHPPPPLARIFLSRYLIKFFYPLLAPRARPRGRLLRLPSVE